MSLPKPQQAQTSKLISTDSNISPKYRLLSLFLGVSLTVLPLKLMGKDGIQLSVGGEYTTGTFGGAESIDEWYIPITGRLIQDRYVFRITIPYVRLIAPPGTVPISADSSSEVITTGTGDRITEQGLGDIIASVTYQDVLNTELSNFAVDLTGKIKFATADEEKGLGTGENDYTLQVDAFRFYERFNLFGGLGYTLRGDPPGVNLDNVGFGIIGATYRLTPVVSTGLDYYYRQSSFAEGSEQQEMSVQIAYKLSKGRKIRGYALRGLSDGSPDWGAGAMFTVSY